MYFVIMKLYLYHILTCQANPHKFAYKSTLTEVIQKLQAFKNTFTQQVLNPFHRTSVAIQILKAELGVQIITSSTKNGIISSLWILESREKKHNLQLIDFLISFQLPPPTNLAVLHKFILFSHPFILHTMYIHKK